MKFGILYGIWRRLAGGGGPAQTGSAQTPPRGSGTESSAAGRMRGAIEHYLRALACERPRSDLDTIQALDESGMHEARARPGQEYMVHCHSRYRMSGV
jgi:hypothetical protein